MIIIIAVMPEMPFNSPAGSSICKWKENLRNTSANNDQIIKRLI